MYRFFNIPFGLKKKTITKPSPSHFFFSTKVLDPQTELLYSMYSINALIYTKQLGSGGRNKLK